MLSQDNMFFQMPLSQYLFSYKLARLRSSEQPRRERTTVIFKMLQTSGFGRILTSINYKQRVFVRDDGAAVSPTAKAQNNNIYQENR